MWTLGGRGLIAQAILYSPPRMLETTLLCTNTSGEGDGDASSSLAVQGTRTRTIRAMFSASKRTITQRRMSCTYIQTRAILSATKQTCFILWPWTQSGHSEVPIWPKRIEDCAKRTIASSLKRRGNLWIHRQPSFNLGSNV